MTKALRKRAAYGEQDYALLTIEPLRYIRTTLDNATAPIPLRHLIESYQHVNPTDYSRIKLHEDLGNDDAQTWLIRAALTALTRWVDIIERDGEEYIQLKEDCSTDDMRWKGKKLHSIPPDQSRYLKSPFDPMLESGTFAKNIRRGGLGDLTELRESMKMFGWLQHHPAIKDENGIVLVGHRRLAVAAELGIAVRENYEFVVINFGHGDPADSERLKYALGSNLGNRHYTPADRKWIAQRLYGEDNLTMEAIANLLNVTAKTVSQDLEGFYPVKTPSRPKGGRPKGSTSKRTPKQEAALDACKAIDERGEPVTKKAVMKEAGVSDIVARVAVPLYEERKERAEEDKKRDVINLSVVSSTSALDRLRSIWAEASSEERAAFLAEINS